MTQSEDASEPASGGTLRMPRGAGIPPLVWSTLIAGGLLFEGLVLTAVLVTVSLSLWKVGILIMGLSLLALTAIPGGLHLLGHPQADVGYRRPLRERVNHPRLAGLAWMWLGIAAYGWISVMTVVFAAVPLLPTLWVPILLGFGPVCALFLFDRRR